MTRITFTREWLEDGLQQKSSHYKYLVILYVLVNTDSVLQAFINDVLWGKQGKFVITYIDDLLV